MKGYGWLVVPVLLIAILLCGGVASALQGLADSYTESQAAYWNGKSQYVLAEAGANAVRADTQTAHGLDSTEIMGYVMIAGAFAVIVWQNKQIMGLFQQRNTLPACLPTEVSDLMSAPERQNTPMKN